MLMKDPCSSDSIDRKARKLHVDSLSRSEEPLCVRRCVYRGRQHYVPLCKRAAIRIHPACNQKKAAGQMHFVRSFSMGCLGMGLKGCSAYKVTPANTDSVLQSVTSLNSWTYPCD